MISLEDFLTKIKERSKGNKRLLKKAEELWYKLCDVCPEDRFYIIYDDIGPNVEQLKDICEMFDVYVYAFSIRFEASGEYIEITGEDREHMELRILNTERIERLCTSLQRLLTDE